MIERINFMDFDFLFLQGGLSCQLDAGSYIYIYVHFLIKIGMEIKIQEASVSIHVF